MLDALVNAAGSYVHTNPALALVAVFVGGVLTASNPCVLVSIPLTIGFVAGSAGNDRHLVRGFVLSLLFIAGLTTTFVVFGMTAALAGQLYGGVSSATHWLFAAVCVLMGLQFAGVIRLPVPAVGARLQPKLRGWLGAWVLGLLFGIVSAPCAAPVLVVVLAYVATRGSSVIWGAALLLTYALGHSVLILVAGTSMGAARTLIENKKATRALALMRRLAGGTIVGVGVYFAVQGWQ